MYDAGTEKNNTPQKSHSLVVFAEKGANREKAERLADHLNVDMTQAESDTECFDLVLRLNADGLALIGDGMVLRGDFTRMLPRLKTSNLQRELLVRASKIKGAAGTPTAIDATAGLGEDAILLAAAGFSVQLYEYDPVIVVLLQDALCRAAAVPELTDIVGRMSLHEEDSVAALQKLSSPPDLILLDPMFPARQKSALIKKKFQLLHHLERPCEDEMALLHAATASGPRKVIIKRPLKGPYLAGLKPDYSLEGKAIRFDCFVLPRREKQEQQKMK